MLVELAGYFLIKKFDLKNESVKGKMILITCAQKWSTESKQDFFLKISTERSNLHFQPGRTFLEPTNWKELSFFSKITTCWPGYCSSFKKYDKSLDSICIKCTNQFSCAWKKIGL